MPGKYERKDSLYHQAKSDGYRCRAAYKLIELDKRFRFLRAGARVVDLGCAPGGWLQVASERVSRSGHVVGVDLVPVDPITSAGTRGVVPQVVVGDMLEGSVQERVIELMGGPADVVLSDMSPKLSGIRFADVARAAALVEATLAVADRILRPGGLVVAKVFPGQEANELVPLFRQRFRRFQRCVLDSSRKSSTEQYFVGLEFSAAAGGQQALQDASETTATGSEAR